MLDPQGQFAVSASAGAGTAGLARPHRLQVKVFVAAPVPMINRLRELPEFVRLNAYCIWRQRRYQGSGVPQRQREQFGGCQNVVERILPHGLHFEGTAQREPDHWPGEPGVRGDVAILIERFRAARRRRGDIEPIPPQPLRAIVAWMQTEHMRLHNDRSVIAYTVACSTRMRMRRAAQRMASRPVRREKAASIHSAGRSCTLRRMRSCHQLEMERRSSA
jgi:hypothetical protein